MKKLHTLSASLLAVAGLFSVNSSAVAAVIDFSALTANLSNPVSPTVGGLTFSDSQQYIMFSAYGPNSYKGNILSGILSNSAGDSRFLTIHSAEAEPFSLTSFLVARNSCCSSDSVISVKGFFENGTTSTLTFDNLTRTSYTNAVLNWTDLKSVQMKSNAAFGGYYSFESFSTTAGVPAVPEPETYAMLLAGLGVMGLVARRRKAV